MNSQPQAYDFEIDSDTWQVQTAESDTFMDKLQNIASISQLVRLFGAAAIIASMSLFMLQGWAEGNDITRYLKLLAQTGLITGAGLVLSFVVKEVKGARLFFGLSLISVVANFTILGALTYSMFPLDGQLVDYPSMMKWEVVDPVVFLPVFVGAFMLLSVVAYFSFSIYARSIAKPLTLGFLALSAFLLVPLRSSIAVAVMATVAFWGAWVLVKRLSQQDKVVFTPETKAALAMLALPGSIIVARALSLYHIDSLMMLAFSGLAYAVLRNIAGMIDEVNLKSRLVDMSQFVLGIYIPVVAVDLLPLGISDLGALFISVGVLVFALDQLQRSHDEIWKRWLIRLTALTILPTMLLFALFNGSLVYVTQAFIALALMLALSVKARRDIGGLNVVYTFASIATIVAFLMVLFEIVQLINLGNWVTIGLAGGVLIFGASLYERFGLSLSFSKPRLGNELALN